MVNNKWIVFILCGAGLVGCQSTPPPDVYSSVTNACKYTVSGGSKMRTTEAEIQSSSLTDECRNALEPLIPYDQSMKDLPQWRRDQVTEAFQLLIGYPLQLPPDGRVLGVAPHTIMLAAYCIFEPLSHPNDCPRMWFDQTGYPDVNQNVFNFVINQIDTITNGGSTDPGTAARFDLVKLNNRTLKIFDGFWNAPTPFLRSSTLTHEAFHGEGRTHTICADGTPSCDADFSGAYGMNISYNEALMHGSGSLKGSDGKHILSDFDILYLGFENCIDIRGTGEANSAHLLKYPQGLHDLLDPLSCYELGADWYIKQEGLTR